MLLTLTRDSVAMGDDATAPHARQVALPESATLEDLVHWLEVHGVGVSVSRGSTWALVLGTPTRYAGMFEGDERVAAVLTSAGYVRLLLPPGTPVLPGSAGHLDYLLAQGIATTLARVPLGRDRLRAPDAPRTKRLLRWLPHVR